MHTETTTETTTASTTSRKGRNSKRPTDAATVAATETLAATTAEAKPAVLLTDEQRARIEKEKAKLEKEERAAARRKERLAALERGEELPAATKGLPQVVKMNDLGQVARNLHRAYELLASEEVAALDPAVDPQDRVTASDAASCAARLRDLAITAWESQFAIREAAGAAGNETLAPLNLTRDAEGKVTLVIEKKAKPE